MGLGRQTHITKWASAAFFIKDRAPEEGAMHGVWEIVSWLKILKQAIPEMLWSVEFILVRLALFGILLYGLYHLLAAVVRAHGGKGKPDA